MEQLTQPIQSESAHRTVEELLKGMGGSLRALRVNHHLSQEETAAKAGVSLRTLGNLENEGRSTVETLLRVLRALGVAEPLGSLVPETRVSPMALLRSAGAVPQRVRKRRTEQAPFDARQQPSAPPPPPQS